MRWLLDANLSYRLVRRLESHIPVLHVSRTGLAPAADDRLIWEWARQNDYLIITNDEDFYRLAGVYGFPPKVVLRMGNQSTRHVAETLVRHLVDIQSLADTAELGILELY
ncbi:DUF5615 family PIN-like protein [Hymenobacter sp. 5516J-16]|uniref:DUF5615 family PIN-like protein n=1 Tax=Hymenobacter sp. 5516J-16 TaxID=2932253 RepID=UPI001FD35C25|nr:DUF5615 family PIN-like protein [Hymenobacter sp. 5516J-16]UOQ78564.1 DUF5615 family PIN-like protein [Hymenobacter sp. 5516J-16]